MGATLGKGSRFPWEVALIWIVSAIGSVLLRDQGHAVMLLWLPSAVAVCALYRAKRGERLPVIAALLVANLIFNFWYGLTPLALLGYTVANIVEPLLAVAIAHRVIGKRKLESLRLRDTVFLFAGIVFASFSAAIIALPFGPHRDWVQFVWWGFSTSLGTAVGAPILFYLMDWITRRRAGKKRDVGPLLIWFGISMLTMFALSWFVLGFDLVPLAPVVMSALVLIVARYGQIGASVSIFMFGVAGTLRSVGGETPVAYLQFPPFEAGIALQLLMMLMMATSLPLAALLLDNDRLAMRLKARNARMRENLLMLNMAEEVGRIGRWHYNPRTGEQDWSRQMYLINGLDPTLGRDPGDLTSMLPDGGAELFGLLAHHSKDRARYSFEYRVCPPQADERILRMYATNEFNEAGDLTGMFGVVMDVTEHHQRQEALDRERTRAMRLAAEAQYLAHTDPLTGLANRRRTITQLQKCIHRSQEDGRPTALISFDIDHFKRVNDTSGHQMGDDVLVRIADIARAQARASDLIGRIGGEEFVWILPGAGQEETRAAAERLRQAIEQESSQGGLPQVTASVGYTMWREGDDANSLLARVDAALYDAKEAGRNNVQQAA
ncbi:sensor domain-containing diguanylate cyclase [Altererythrobacter sp. CC-YST694]|uniref:sensor domain-containing diguanylate cyclase n=1 Tax=Altererythrobacter sp. CC-YST694 TaxID=2755038 RepID=UPI001D0188A2|nr:diguanylate cyclase [Altererythrobacter sp. CC-YST694]MCB5424070.1 sensor domain-containing diguanylate cyclase [Altererythrobacter sp. CC-YST694]